jgi:putative transcriptional regulator
MIKFRLEERLGDRSLYWLAKEAGISYSTIHKLKKTPPKGISFEVLDKLCDALNCTPGDLLVKRPQRKD